MSKIKTMQVLIKAFDFLKRKILFILISLLMTLVLPFIVQEIAARYTDKWIDNLYEWINSFIPLIFKFPFLLPAFLLTLFILIAFIKELLISTTQPIIDIDKAYSKTVDTVDFVKYNKGLTIPERFTGGTVSPGFYRPALRELTNSTGSYKEEFEELSVAQIDFVNNRNRFNRIETAYKLSAIIVFLDDSGNSILDSRFIGKWSEIEEPSTSSKPIRDYELEEIDLPPNGNPRTLCIALKIFEEANCYAYNNKSYYGSYEFLKNPSFILPEGNIYIKVNLRSNNFSGEYRFLLINKGENSNLEFCHINKFPFNNF